MGKGPTPAAASPLPLKGAPLAARQSRFRGGRSGDEAALGATLAALADPTRRAVVGLLARGPQRAGDIAATLGMPPATLSRHLRVLRKGGLIADDEPEDDARVRLYRLRPQALQPLQGWLAELESYWSDQLQAFKAYAESAAARGRKR